MRAAYLDTSAAVKLIVHESESAALRDELRNGPDRSVLASWMLHTELHCAAGRRPHDVDLESVDAMLNDVELVDLDRTDLIAVGAYAPLRSNDAIHLAVALRLGVDEMFTYDQELADLAQAHGIDVVAPA